MVLLALTGASTLTSLGLGLGAVALIGLWANNRQRGMAGVQRQTVGLGGQHALHVVELDGRRLLVGTGPGAAPRLLTELSPPPACPQGPTPGGG